MLGRKSPGVRPSSAGGTRSPSSLIIILLGCSMLLNSILLFKGILFPAAGGLAHCNRVTRPLLSPAVADPQRRQQQQQNADGIRESSESNSSSKSSSRVSAPRVNRGRSSGGFLLCDDSCDTANDGVCDEGRSGNLTKGDRRADVNWVYCDLGTDCSDCGPWHGVAHGSSWKQRSNKTGRPVGPIQYLQELDIEVRVRQTLFEPTFFFAYTDPAKDSDESAHMDKSRMIEPVLSQLAVKVLQRVCDPQHPGSSGHLVDVGGNFGWFSVLGASLGCRVTSFEPVPIFQAFFEYSAARNGLRGLITLHPAVVSNDTSRTYTLTVPTTGQWGATKVGQKQTPGAAASIRVEAPAVSLRAVLPADEHIDLLKVDVEGYEPIVMAEASSHIKAGRVDNIMFEYAPAYFAGEMNDRGPGNIDALPRMMLDLFDVGYEMGWLPWGLVFTSHHMLSPISGGSGWGAPLPEMQQINRKHSEYDLWSMQALRDGKLPGMKGPGSWPCKPMAEAGISPKPDWLGAHWAHWHPKGLHAAFIFNTNIFASRDMESVAKLQGLVGAEGWPAGYSSQKHWFPKVEMPGTTYYDGCKEAKFALAARCRCPADAAAVCGKQQAAVEQCERLGQLGYPDLD